MQNYRQLLQREKLREIIMRNFLKKIPSVILFVLLAIVYLACGYVVGYHQGYKFGQKDYIEYVNKVLEKN